MKLLPACLAALALLSACARRPELPVMGHVPRFQLTSQTGAPFDSQSLQGKIWAADFFFTSCTGPCPRMSSQMHWLQTQVSDLADVRLVSFTVDPARDTPAALADYSERFRADSARWFLLTGPQATLNSLDRDAFKLGDVDGRLMHSTRFVLIDRRGRIRGYFDSEEDDGLQPLVRALRQLAKEPA